MATQKPRINMVLDPARYDELEGLAKREGRSLSDLARSFVLEMLEIVEDVELAALASERRRTFSSAKALTHRQVWTQGRSERHELYRRVPSRRRKARSS